MALGKESGVRIVRSLADYACVLALSIQLHNVTIPQNIQSFSRSVYFVGVILRESLSCALSSLLP